MGEWLAFTFALTGRREWGHDTQGVALGYELAGLSARAEPQIGLLHRGASAPERGSGAARTFGEGLRRSTVAHFARKVRGTNIVAAKHG